MWTAFWASWSATGSAGWSGPGWNHHATQLHMPMTESAASRSSRGRNSPLDTPSSMMVRSSARTSRRALRCRAATSSGSAASVRSRTRKRSGALEYQRTDHGPQLLDRAEVGAKPDLADDARGVLADVLDERGEQLFFAADVVVEPGPGDPDGIGDVLQRGPVVSALGEEPGGVLEDFRHHQLAA